MAKTALQYDRSGKSRAESISRPLDLSVFGNVRLSGGGRVIASAIRSFGRGEHSAKFKYHELSTRYNISVATVAREIKKIKLSDAFERGKKVYLYKFKGGEPSTNEYITIPDWFNFITVTVNGRKKLLTVPQMEVLAYIRSFSPNGIRTSCRWIAKKLGISHVTVSRAIKILKDEVNGIIEIEGENGYEESVNKNIYVTYKVNSKRLRQIKAGIIKSTPKSVADKQKAIEERNINTREEYYRAVTWAEDARINKVESDLNADRDYTECKNELSKTEISLTKAEYQEEQEGYSDDVHAKIAELRARKEELAREYREHLERLGYAENDLIRHNICAECKDTGKRDDGTPCDCWKRRGRLRR